MEKLNAILVDNINQYTFLCAMIKMDMSSLLFEQIAQTFGALRRILLTKLKEEGVSLSMEQFHVLTLIYKSDGITQQELADIMLRDKAAIFRQVKVMLENNWLMRKTDKTDARKKNLELTKEGTEIFTKALGVTEEVSKDVLSNMNADDAQAIGRIRQTVFNYRNNQTKQIEDENL